MRIRHSSISKRIHSTQGGVSTFTSCVPQWSLLYRLLEDHLGFSQCTWHSTLNPQGTIRISLVSQRSLRHCLSVSGAARTSARRLTHRRLLHLRRGVERRQRGLMTMGAVQANRACTELSRQ